MPRSQIPSGCQLTLIPHGGLHSAAPPHSWGHRGASPRGSSLCFLVPKSLLCFLFFLVTRSSGVQVAQGWWFWQLVWQPPSRQMRGQSENCQLANLYMKVKSYSWFSPSLFPPLQGIGFGTLSSVRSLLSAPVSTPWGWFDWEHSERSWSTVL